MVEGRHRPGCQEPRRWCRVPPGHSVAWLPMPDHDPAVGSARRYNRERWKGLETLRTHESVHNLRRPSHCGVRRGDGAFAVVDVDTLWRRHRTAHCSLEGTRLQGYTSRRGWLLILHTGSSTRRAVRQRRREPPASPENSKRAQLRARKSGISVIFLVPVRPAAGSRTAETHITHARR